MTAGPAAVDGEVAPAVWAGGALPGDRPDGAAAPEPCPPDHGALRQLGSPGREPSWLSISGTKGSPFDSRSGHMPSFGLEPWWGGMQEAADGCFALHINASLSPFLSLNVSKEEELLLISLQP